MKIKSLAIIFSILVSTFIGISPSLVSADSNNNCLNGSNIYGTPVSELPSSGMAYIKLGNSDEPDQQVQVYQQNINDNSCSLVGTVNATFKQWTKLGNFNSVPNSVFVVSGNNLSALPYQAAATILLLPDSSICEPVIQCQIDLNGNKVVILPKTLSGNTDQVAVQEIQPLTGTKTATVNYYSNNVYLYSSKSVKPVDHRYLGSGINNINIKITLESGQVVYIYQTINMGNDPTGYYTFRSFLFRKHGETLFALVFIILIILVLSLLAVARYIYKKRRYNKTHGITKYAEDHPEDLLPPDGTPPIAPTVG